MDRSWTDIAYAAKAWLGTLVAAVGLVFETVVAATADESISLTEARGLVLAAGGVLTVLATFTSIFKAKNAQSTWRTSSDPPVV
jgi:hypothetical protein